MAETKTTAAAPVEAAATYTAAELIAAAPEKFGVSRDIATAALWANPRPARAFTTGVIALAAARLPVR